MVSLFIRRGKKRSKRQARAAARKTLVPPQPVYGQAYEEDPAYGDYGYAEEYPVAQPLPKAKKRRRHKKVALSVSLNCSVSYCYW